MKRIHFLSDVRSCADAPFTNYVNIITEALKNICWYVVLFDFFGRPRLKSFSRMPKTNSIIKYYADTPVIFMCHFLFKHSFLTVF